MADKCRQVLVDEEAVVPTLWWFEVRNLLVIAGRRGRVNEDQSARALHSLASLLVVRDDQPEEGAVLLLARKNRLTVYDAAYLELAIRRGLPIATLDKALSAAARNEKCPLLEVS